MQSYGTFGEMIAGGFRIRAWCDACNHHRLLDLEALAAQLGPGHPATYDAITPRLRCSSCGAKKSSLIVAPPMPRVTSLSSSN